MTTTTYTIIVVVVLTFLAIIWLMGSLYRKVGPNRALIVYGSGGTRVIVGGGTLVKPLFQRADEFSLELMSFDVAPNYALYTNQGVPVQVEAITQLKVENEEDKIRAAANQFLSKPDEERQTMVRQVMEGHLRGIVGQLTVEQLVKEPELVSERMRSTVAADLDKLGLEVVSFTLKDVADDSGYISNMSRPEIAHNKQIAEIAEAEADRNVAMRQADTQRESAQARARADQERVLAETLSKTAQSEAQRDLDVKQAEYLATVSQQKAQADRAYDIQSTISQQRLVEEQGKVEIVQKEQAVKIQQAEAARRAAELVATVQRQAEAENEKIRILADAEQKRTIISAEGQARSRQLQAEAEANAVVKQAEGESQAIKMRGLAEAEALKAKGLAEADALRAKGLAEAEALRRKIDVLNGQNQAAILDKALSNLPVMAEKMFEAYAKIGNVTYVTTGDGEGVTGRVSRDIIGMLPMLNAMFETTTGMRLRELIQGAPPTTNGSMYPGDPEVPGTAMLETPLASPVEVGGAETDSVLSASTAATSDNAPEPASDSPPR
jgi:flotillin